MSTNNSSSLHFRKEQALAVTVQLALLWCLSAGSAFCESLTVLPGVKGFGVQTPAGSGRHSVPARSQVMKVTTLADSGPGSLRACVESIGARTCVFEISGEIKLLNFLKIREPFLTVAGQTAPRPGITLTRAGIKIETHDVLIQHIAVRPGDDSGGVDPGERDGITIGGKPPNEASNVVIDHVSVTWALDENLSTWYPTTRDITVSNSLIAEGLDRSIHPKGPHSKGLMIGDGTQRVTVTKNLIAENTERNPYLKPGTLVEFFNNVVYGWGPGGGWSLCNLSDNSGINAPQLLSFVGNIYKPGPWSAQVPAVYGKKVATGTKVFVRDNIGPGRVGGVGDEWGITSLDRVFFSDQIPFEGSGLKATPAAETLAAVLCKVGSRPHERDAVDSRIVQEVKEGKGGIKDCVSGCPAASGGWPLLTSSARSVHLPDDPFGDSDRDGYTNLENWLHRMSLDVEGGECVS